MTREETLLLIHHAEYLRRYAMPDESDVCADAIEAALAELEAKDREIERLRTTMSEAMDKYIRTG